MDRLAAAQDRVRKVEAELRSPARELPCVQCRYFELVCTHPAASEISVSPISGATKATHFDAAKVRADDGACGPEGALFDARSVPGQLVIGFLSTSIGRWGVFIALAVLADMLLR